MNLGTVCFAPLEPTTQFWDKSPALDAIQARHSALLSAQNRKMKLGVSLASALSENIALFGPTASTVQAESILTQWETLIVFFVNKVATAIVEVRRARLVMLGSRPLLRSTLA